MRISVQWSTLMQCSASNFRKLKRIVVIFAMQHQESNANLELQRSPLQLISAATLPCKMKRSL